MFCINKENETDLERLGYVCNPCSLKEGTETSHRRTDEFGSRLERPIHFECKLNEPIHIGMRLLHPAAGIIWESASPNFRHESSTENACRSPTLLMDVSASRSRVFIERNFSSTVYKAQMGPAVVLRALETGPKSV